MRFEFIQAEKANHAVAMMCRLLEVSRSGYYAWIQRPTSDRAQADRVLLPKVRAAFKKSRGTYGAPRVQKELEGNDLAVSRKRVARIMREDGLKGRSGRRGTRTTWSDPSVDAPDLLQRDFTADAPNRVWVADTTYLHCTLGFVYLVVIIDLYSRRVVGWAVGAHHDAALTLSALSRAIARRGPPPGLIFHTDHGSEFTAHDVLVELNRIGALRSLGSVGDCYDNAVAESFFGTYKGDTGILDGLIFTDISDATCVASSYIDAFYNAERRHSTIDYMSPNEYESNSRSLPHAP